MPRRNRELLLLILVIVLMFTGFITVQLARDATVDAAGLLYPGAISVIFFLIHLLLRRVLPQADPMMLPLCAGLTAIGVVMIERLDNKLALDQLLWIVVAAVCLVLVVLFLRNYEILSQYKYIIGIATVVLLVSSMIFGREVNGARLWLKIGPMNFQPSELAKVLLVIFLAAFLAEKHELLSISTHRVAGIPVPEIKYFVPLLVMWGFSVGILVFQKDLGSSLLFFGIFIAMLYVATGRKMYVLVGAGLFLLGAYLCYLSFSHVQLRVETWLHPFDPATIQRQSYQISQSMFALSSGGLTGTGLGLGHPTFIPSVTTDFIFSAIGEELGLIGAASVVLLFVLFCERGFKVALRQRDDFGKLLAVGLTSIIAIQTFIILGGVTRLIPLTGITLPFVSYGGSSLVANFIILGLLLVISHRGATTNVESLKEGVKR